MKEARTRRRPGAIKSARTRTRPKTDPSKIDPSWLSEPGEIDKWPDGSKVSRIVRGRTVEMGRMVAHGSQRADYSFTYRVWKRVAGKYIWIGLVEGNLKALDAMR